jgi:hypothetical protein
MTDLGQRKNSTLLKKVFEVLRSHGSLPPHFDAAALANVEKEHKAEVQFFFLWVTVSWNALKQSTSGKMFLFEKAQG